MKTFLNIALLVVLICIVTDQYRQMNTLANQVETQQLEIDALRSEVGDGVARSTVALKLGLTNKSSIQNIRRKRLVHVTAYSPRENETDSSPFFTASNRRVRHGIVAVSRDLFDEGWVFGRKIYIKSLGIFTIDDLMATSKKNQVDIFMFDTEQALLFGRRTLEAHLLATETDTEACTETESDITNIRYVTSLND